MLTRRGIAYSVLSVTVTVFLFVPAVISAQPVKREAHTPEEQYRFAEGLYTRGFYDLAEVEFRYFLDCWGDHESAPAAHFQLIKCLRHQQKDDATLSAIAGFQSKWPEHKLASRLFLWKGELLLKAGKIPVAADCFRRLVISPDTVTREAAIYLLGQCYARQDKLDLSLKTYAKIADKPFDGEHQYRPYALFAVAAASQHRGKLDSAAQAFARLKDAENVPDGIREEATYRLGEVKFVLGAFQEAVEQYERLLVEFPDGSFSREARKRRAWAYFSLEKYGKAVDLIRDWRRRYGEVFDYEIDYVYAASLLGEGLFTEALEVLGSFVEDLRIPEDYALLGRYQQVLCLLRLERFEQVLERADAFLSAFPNSPRCSDVHYFVGEAAYQLKRYGMAAAELKKATEAFVGDWVYLKDAYMRLTECLTLDGRHAEAAVVFRGLVEDKSFGDPAYCLVRAGECWREVDSRTEAIADFERVLSDFPDSHEEVRAAMLNLGELYAETQMFEKAVPLLQKLLADEGVEEKGHLLFFLGYVRYRQGKYVVAESALRGALKEKDSTAVTGNARCFLSASLLAQAKDKEALRVFSELLAEPEEKYPAFPDSLLLKLEKLYYDRNDYRASERLSRWLSNSTDATVRHEGGKRLARLQMAQNRFSDAEKLLVRLLEENADPGGVAYRELQSLYGEVLMSFDRFDEAVKVFEDCLAEPGLGERAATRARWGMSSILAREGRNKQAFHYAVNAFVLADDPTYTPRAMFLAVELLQRLGNREEAVVTWRELKTRFPSFAEQRAQHSVVVDLLTADSTDGQDR